MQIKEKNSSITIFLAFRSTIRLFFSFKDLILTRQEDFIIFFADLVTLAQKQKKITVEYEYKLRFGNRTNTSIID